MTDETTIEERENGPLLVRNLRTMVLADGTTPEIKPVRALCRCGGSKNKPFCDGSHKENGFKSRGGEPQGKDRLHSYTGEDISIFYNPRLCSHAAECVRRARHIFDPKKRPWVQLDQGSVEEVEAVVQACPSGALTISNDQNEPVHRVESGAPQIRVQKNGPLWVNGIAPPGEPGGQSASDQKYVLCRCGLSGNKPYCDGSHLDARWKDAD